MKVIDIINSKRQFPSLEFVPPLKGTDIRKLYANIERLMEFKPPFINVTCHTDEVKYFENPDGSIARKTITKRPGTVAIAAAIMKRFDVEVVPHIICAGMNKWQIENELLDLNFLEINNVMALRGEAPGGMKRFEAARDGYKYASQLVEQIENLNRGKYPRRRADRSCPDEFLRRCGGLSRQALRSSKHRDRHTKPEKKSRCRRRFRNNPNVLRQRFLFQLCLSLQEGRDNCADNPWVETPFKCQAVGDDT
jgi:hypothetical protein